MRLSDGCVTTLEGIRLFFQKPEDGPNAVIVPNAYFMFDDCRRLAKGRTVIFLDWRNRGRSDSVADTAALRRGIHHDVDDLEAVRRHFGFSKIAVIGHSYSGLTAVLYAMQHPAQVDRVVQLGPIQPFPRTEYPPHLKCADQTLQQFLAGFRQLQSAPHSNQTSSADVAGSCCGPFTWPTRRTRTSSTGIHAAYRTNGPS